jgi:hypothetical protein
MPWKYPAEAGHAAFCPYIKRWAVQVAAQKQLFLSNLF